MVHEVAEPLRVTPSRGNVKIAHVATTDMTIRYLLLDQLMRLQEKGYDVTAVSSTGPHVERIRRTGLRFETVAMTRRLSTPVDDVRALWSLYRLFRAEGFQIVHAHTPKAGVLARLAARLAGVPGVIYTHHGFPFDEQDRLSRRFFMWLERIAALSCDLVLSVNQEDIDIAVRERVWPRQKVRLLGRGGIGIDMTRFDPDRIRRSDSKGNLRVLGIPEGVPIVGFVGRLVREKGLPEFFGAAASIRRAGVGAHFLVVGPSDCDKRSAITADDARGQGLEGVCHFLGPRDDLPELYSVMDVLVLPSRREGFGIVLAEAAAMGVPCVASDIRGCREAVEHGRNGFLVPVGDVARLSRAIMEILGDPNRAFLMGREGRRIARERFDQRLALEKVESEYMRILRSKADGKS